MKKMYLSFVSFPSWWGDVPRNSFVWGEKAPSFKNKSIVNNTRGWGSRITSWSSDSLFSVNLFGGVVVSYRFRRAHKCESHGPHDFYLGANERETFGTQWIYCMSLLKKNNNPRFFCHSWNTIALQRGCLHNWNFSNGSETMPGFLLHPHPVWNFSRLHALFTTLLSPLFVHRGCKENYFVVQ